MSVSASARIPPPERAACAPSLRGVADRRAGKCRVSLLRFCARRTFHHRKVSWSVIDGLDHERRARTASIAPVRCRRWRDAECATRGCEVPKSVPPAIGTSRVSDPSFGTPSAPVHEKLAPQVELCSPGPSSRAPTARRRMRAFGRGSGHRASSPTLALLERGRG